MLRFIGFESRSSQMDKRTRFWQIYTVLQRDECGSVTFGRTNLALYLSCYNVLQGFNLVFSRINV